MHLKPLPWKLAGQSEEGRYLMAVAKVVEITSSSSGSFEDAIIEGINKAPESVRGIRGAYVNEQTVRVEGGEIVEYRTDLQGHLPARVGASAARPNARRQ